MLLLFEKKRIDQNKPIGWIITMATMAVITAGWYLVMVHSWPYKAWIGWTLFAIPASITLLLPLMFVIRKIQSKRNASRK